MSRISENLQVAVRYIYLCVLFLCVAAGVAHAQQEDLVPDDPEKLIVEGMIDAGIHESGKDSQTGLSAEVVNPEIDTVELDYRLIPLTKDELSELAKKWLDIVKEKTEVVMAAQIAISRTDNKIEDTAREKLTELSAKRRELFDKYSMVVSAWEKKGGDKETIAEYRAYRDAIIVEETRTADYQTLLAQAQNWAVAQDGGVEVAMDILIILASLIALYFSARIIRRLARRWLAHVPNLSMLLQAFLVTMIYWLVMAVGLMIVLSALGIDISPAFALIGGATFILAFAFQESLGNLASGLMIMVTRPFDRGDYVDIGGVSGTVEAVSIVATTILTPDNQVIVIPNKNVWSKTITNVTASETRRVDLVFGISYNDSIPDAAAVIEDAVKDHPLVLDEPAPTVRVHELADSSVNFICRPWVKTSDYWTVYWDLMQQVKERFDAAGISIPYPQQDVHFINADGQALREYGKRMSHPGKSDQLDIAARPKKTSDKSRAIAKGDHDDGDGLAIAE